jgi:hypothetical protein
MALAIASCAVFGAAPFAFADETAELPSPAGAADAAAGIGTARRAGPAGIFRVWVPRAASGWSESSAPLPVEAPGSGAGESGPAGPAHGCAPPGMPAMLLTASPVEFIADGDTVVMRYSAWDASRIVYMQPGAAPAVQPHTLHGTSFGRWEDTTLAIFTTYIDDPQAAARGWPQSRDVTVLERYTPTPDFTRLDWQAIVTDPPTGREPRRIAGYHAYEPGTAIGRFDNGGRVDCGSDDLAVEQQD